jgi:hypothetical protein
MLDLDRVQSRGYGFQLELNWAWKQAGVRVIEIPIVFADRTIGSSKMTWHILRESLAAVLNLRAGRIPVALHAATPESPAVSSHPDRERRDAA